MFFLSLFKPLVWPYPHVPLINCTKKELFDSPVPILASYYHRSSLQVESEWVIDPESTLIHFNLDEEVMYGLPLEVDLCLHFQKRIILPLQQTID